MQIKIVDPFHVVLIVPRCFRLLYNGVMVGFMGKFFTKKWLFAFGIFLVIIVIVFFKIRTGKALSKTGTPLKQYTVARKDLENVVSLSGVVAAQEKVVLQFQSSGRLVWVGVQEGDVVTKGQVL